MQHEEFQEPETLSAALRKRCEWHDVALIERDGADERWYGHPREDWGAWEITRYEPAPSPTVPYQRLLGDDGEIAPSFLVRRTVKLLDAAGIVSGDPGRIDPRVAAAFAEADAAMRANWLRYVRAIPAEHRAIAGPLESGQWRLLMALAADPALAGDLRSEFAAAGTGYLFACLSLAGIEFPSGHADARILRDALHAPRAEFLGHLAGRKIDKPTARILGKAAMITNRRTLLRIAALARDPALRQVLAHMPVLKYPVCHGATVLPRAMISPGVLNMLARSAPDYADCEALSELARQITRRRKTDAGVFAAYIASAADRADLKRRLGDWSDRLLPTPKPARPPFPGDDRLVPLTSSDALTRAGQRFKNCLSNRFMAHTYIQRNSIVYEWRGRRPALVHLSNDSGAWSIAEIRDMTRRTPPRAVCNRIAREVYRRLLRASARAAVARRVSPRVESDLR